MPRPGHTKKTGKPGGKLSKLSKARSRKKEKAHPGGASVIRYKGGLGGDSKITKNVR